MSYLDYCEIKICRLCESSNNLITICGDKSIDVHKIQSCVNIEIDENDLLPKWICSVCKLKIEKFYKFKYLCKETEKKFHEIIKNNTTVHLNHEYTKIKQENEIFIEDFNGFEIEEDIKYSESLEEDAEETLVETDDVTQKISLNTGLVKVRHQAKPNHIKTFECNICKKMLGNEKTLRIHKRIHKEEELYNCNQCDKMFNIKDNLRRHKLNVHDEVRPFVCDICGKSFKQKTSLQSHEAVHVTVANISCDMCPKKFKTIFKLNQHKTSHLSIFNGSDKNTKVSNLRIYVCSYCGKTLKNIQSYNAHVRTHTGERPYTCDICGMKFNTQITMKKHHNIHTGIKQYKCKECGKNFRQSHHLKLHIKIHTGERPFPCIECKKAFKQKADLELHTRRHTGERPFGCDLCPMKFIEKRLLQRHVKKIHENSTTPDQKSIIELYDAS